MASILTSPLSAFSCHVHASPPISTRDSLGTSGRGLFLNHPNFSVSGLRLASSTRSLSQSSSAGVWPRRISCRKCAKAGAASSSAEDDKDSTTASAVNSDELVLVLGATGGVGQLVVATLLDRGYRVRALLRDRVKADTIFTGRDDRLQVHVGDLRNRDSLTKDVFQGVSKVVCTTGTTAFPSKRWDGNNNPEQADWVAVRNVVEAVPRNIQRFVLVSSIGVTKSNELPFNILNLFGVLKYKKMGEDHLRSSGIPFTIIRAGRLTDGPYTSYDLNTLLKATAGKRQQVTIAQGDNYKGETSRLAVAEACVQALSLDCTEGQAYEVGSVEGDGPGKDRLKWEALFMRAHATV